MRLENVSEDSNETRQAIEDTMESLGFDIEEKVENIIKVMRNYEAEITAIDDEVRRLQLNKCVKQNKVKNLKEYLKDNLIRLGRNKVETPLFRASLKNNPGRVEVLHEALVPAEYMKTSYSVDKTLLKEALMNEEKAKELNELGITMVQDVSLMIK